MATPSPTSLPTRQQLDEIDALLKRMMSLPPLPGEPAEQAPSREPPAPAITYPSPTIREVPPPQTPLAHEPNVREWRVEWPQAPAAPPPPVVAWGSPVPAAAPGPPAYAIVAQAEAPFAAPIVSPYGYVPGQPPPSVARPPESLPVQVLTVLNGAFHVLTYFLGPPGTWLRGSGRNLLGWSGILMALAAAAWAAGEWAGYNWPPIDLSKFGEPVIRR
jgi:hypothetical protein